MSETGQAGYAATIGGDCAADGSITLALGAVKSCTITNDDVQPKLIVIKHVVNDNGGTKTAGDFTMTVTGSSPSPASFAGAESPGTTMGGNFGGTEGRGDAALIGRPRAR